jgi:hypothetical protein
MADNALVTTDEREHSREQQRVERALTRLRGVGELMDDKFELPLVKVKVGLDPLIGLIPGGGDWVSWAVSVYIVLEAARLGVPAQKLLRMGWNISVDLVGGYAPGVGDFFDVLFKANRRNVDMVLDHFDASVDTAAPGVVRVPTEALDKPREGSAFARWFVALALVVLSFALASVPILVIWYFFSSGG